MSVAVVRVNASSASIGARTILKIFAIVCVCVIGTTPRPESSCAQSCAFDVVLFSYTVQYTAPPLKQSWSSGMPLWANGAS